MLHLDFVSIVYRLSVSAEPANILKLVPPKTVVMCVQFCPLQEVLYVAVGLPKSLSSSTIPADPAITSQKSGKWIVDRVRTSCIAKYIKHINFFFTDMCRNISAYVDVVGQVISLFSTVISILMCCYLCFFVMVNR